VCEREQIKLQKINKRLEREEQREREPKMRKSIKKWFW